MKLLRLLIRLFSFAGYYSRPEPAKPEPLHEDGGDVMEETHVEITDTSSVAVTVPLEILFPEVSETITEEVTEAIIPEYRARYMWCIDNGHGGLTAGKRSPVLPDGRQLLEYEFNRDVTARIFKRLDEEGVQYYNVVPEDDTVGNFLTGRVARANNFPSLLPKLFVSVHGNAGPAPSLQHFTDDEVRGIETWHFRDSSPSRQLAAVFQRHLIERTGYVNRHLRTKKTGQFYVLRATRMPAVLTENGFYNNRFDLVDMLTPAFRQTIADAHVDAIMEVEQNGL